MWKDYSRNQQEKEEDDRNSPPTNYRRGSERIIHAGILCSSCHEHVSTGYRLAMESDRSECRISLCPSLEHSQRCFDVIHLHFDGLLLFLFKHRTEPEHLAAHIFKCAGVNENDFHAFDDSKFAMIAAFR